MMFKNHHSKKKDNFLWRSKCFVKNSNFQFGNSKSVKGWLKFILQRWCSRIVTAKRKNLIYREACALSKFSIFNLLFHQFGNPKSVKELLKGKLERWCSRIVTAKRKNFSIERQFSTQLSFSIPSSSFQYHFGWEIQFELETKVFRLLLSFWRHSDLFLRIALGNQPVSGLKQNINKYLIIKVNFRFTHVYFMEFLSIFQLKKLWKFITIFGDFWEDTRTVFKKKLFTFLTNKFLIFPTFTDTFNKLYYKIDLVSVI